MLQLNQGPTIGELDSIKHPVFSDIGFFSGIAETDWSWTPLVADFDNDGKKIFFLQMVFPRISLTMICSIQTKSILPDFKKEMLDQIPSLRSQNIFIKMKVG